MRNTYKYFLILVGLTVFLFSSCEDEDAIKLPEITKGAIPYFAKVEPSDQNIDVLNKGLFLTKYSIQFGEEEGNDLVQSATLVASYNGGTPTEFPGKISSFPTEFEISTDDILNSFGITLDDINKGDQMIFGVNLLMKDGQVLPAFSATGNFGYSPTLRATERNNIYFTVNVVCAYDPAFVTGSYNAKDDRWDIDADITIDIDPNDPYRVWVTGLAAANGLTGDKEPLEMIIDPNTFEVSVKKQAIASDVPPTTYKDFSYEGTGMLNTCNGTYQMNFKISVNVGSYGDFIYTFTKN